MADKTDEVCGNCGNKTVLFCSNEFTDFYCTTCRATNLTCVLPKLESITPCKEGWVHDLRIAKQGLFCPRCYKHFNLDGTERKIE